MKKIIIRSNSFSELLNNKSKREIEKENLYKIRQEQKEIIENLVKSLLASLVCDYKIDKVDIYINKTESGESFNDCFKGNVMNLIDGIDGYNNIDKILSLNNKPPITYSKMQKKISDKLDELYFILVTYKDCITIDVSSLRAECLYLKMKKDVNEETSTKMKVNKI